MKYFAGIDPGATGAMAIISEDGQRAYFIDYTPDTITLARQIREHDLIYSIRLAVLEHVHSMPKQGVSSSFKFGTNFGIWQGILATLKIPVQLITPQRWRKILDSSVPQKPTKLDLRLYAIRRFPMAAEFLQRARDDGRAEALLMSAYARQTTIGIIQ